jgi:hypothetical protein
MGCVPPWLDEKLDLTQRIRPRCAPSEPGGRQLTVVASHARRDEDRSRQLLIRSMRRNALFLSSTLIGE